MMTDSSAPDYIFLQILQKNEINSIKYYGNVTNITTLLFNVKK
jgi:hypothetical protein